MPVREVIHSSLVSIKVVRSALLNIAGGRHLPQPVISAYFIDVLSVSFGSLRSKLSDW
jgi:hypothetical protein